MWNLTEELLYYPRWWQYANLQFGMPRTRPEVRRIIGWMKDENTQEDYVWNTLTQKGKLTQKKKTYNSIAKSTKN